MKINDFERHCSTLKNTSFDKIHNEYMSGITRIVYDFDKIMGEYCNNRHNLGVLFHSNDALFRGKNDEWYFVEFKNGRISKNTKQNIKNKISHSLLLLLDILEKNPSYARKKINYILVYNDPSIRIADNLNRLAVIDRIEFNLEVYKGIFLRNVYTIDKNEADSRIMRFMGD